MPRVKDPSAWALKAVKEPGRRRYWRSTCGRFLVMPTLGINNPPLQVLVDGDIVAEMRGKESCERFIREHYLTGVEGDGCRTVSKSVSAGSTPAAPATHEEGL
jgi:hypothetical protein